jgi:hypothetical protein
MVGCRIQAIERQILEGRQEFAVKLLTEVADSCSCPTTDRIPRLVFAAARSILLGGCEGPLSNQTTGADLTLLEAFSATECTYNRTSSGPGSSEVGGVLGGLVSSGGSFDVGHVVIFLLVLVGFLATPHLVYLGMALLRFFFCIGKVLRIRVFLFCLLAGVLNLHFVFRTGAARRS